MCTNLGSILTPWASNSHVWTSWFLCGEPRLTASSVISLFSPSFCLQEEAVGSSPVATFPPRPGYHVRAMSNHIQHGSAEASATQTIHPCRESGCISSLFPDTTQGTFGLALTISRHEALCQQSGSIQSIYCFRETFKRLFLFFFLRLLQPMLES